MRTSSEFILGPSFGWIETSGLQSLTANGDPAEAAHQARSKAHPYSIAAAGDQAAADVDVGAGGSAEPGNGRKPSPRRGSHRGTAAGRAGAAGEGGGGEAHGGEDRPVGRRRLRVFLRRLPGRRVPVAHAVGSEGTAADREHALVDRL